MCDKLSAIYFLFQKFSILHKFLGAIASIASINDKFFRTTSSEVTFEKIDTFRLADRSHIIPTLLPALLSAS